MNRRNVLVLAGALLAACWAILVAPALAAEGKAAAEPVRKLKVDVAPMDAAKLSTKPGVNVFRSEEEAAKSFGKSVVKQLAGKIDFAKEELVHVSWTSSGPPFGELHHDIKKEKGGEVVTFSVVEPNVPVRGMAARLGNDFFAVPKGVKVAFAADK